MIFWAAKVTVDLDVQVRDDLLSFLKEDSEQRNATILCGYPSCYGSYAIYAN